MPGQQWANPSSYDDWQKWATALIINLVQYTADVNPEVGMIREFAVALPQYGWLPANGLAIDNNSFPSLAQKLGTTFGSAPAGHTRLPSLTPLYGLHMVVGIKT